MYVTCVSAESTPNVVSLAERIMGEFDNHHQLDAYARELGQSDGNTIVAVEALEGEAGEACLGKLKRSVEGFLDAVLGDMESEMLRTYEQSVAQGRVVFAVLATAQTREQVASLAVQRGATNVVHFGTFVVEDMHE